MTLLKHFCFTVPLFNVFRPKPYPVSSRRRRTGAAALNGRAPCMVIDGPSAELPGNPPLAPTSSNPSNSPPRILNTDSANLDCSAHLEAAILITNDDGLDPGVATVLDVAREVVKLGYRVVVCAPCRNNSACSQKISLGRELTLVRHEDLEREYGASKDGLLHVFSLADGTPADCVIVSIEPNTGLLARLKLRPIMVLSGINIGPNLGPDILYSGTFGAARQAAMYGVPAVASSIAEFGSRQDDTNYERGCARAISGIARLANIIIAKMPEALSVSRDQYGNVDDGGNLMSSELQAVRSAFFSGNVLLNINIPVEWDGDYETCHLDAIFYRSAVNWNVTDEAVEPTKSPDSNSRSAKVGDRIEHVSTLGSGPQRVTIAGGKVEAMRSDRSDSAAVLRGKAALSTLSTWPALHPLAVDREILEAGLVSYTNSTTPAGLPAWINED